MIDIENLVFDTVYNGMTSVHTGVNITKGFVEEEATYPCLVVREINNEALLRTATDPNDENHARVTYQIDAYSNKAGTAMSECRKLLKEADVIMKGMKFHRQRLSEPLNIKRSVFRQYARYTAIIGQGVTTTTGEGQQQVSTTTFQVYRR